MPLGLGLLIVLIVLWLAAMEMAALLPLRPDVVRIIERLVCPPGSRMKVETFVFSYHRPGQRAIGIFSVDANGKKDDIKVRALLAFFGTLFLVSLPLAVLLVFGFQSLGFPPE